MLVPIAPAQRAFTYAALILGLAACSGRASTAKRAQSDKALAESAAVYEEVAARFRKVGETPNLQGPESARYDRDLDVWFVSNVNGTPTAKDNNGYISRLRPDGTPYNLKFIEGGKKGVTLNAPKGLAINGDTLWVADIDFARAFNKRTGAAHRQCDHPRRAKFLNGAAVGPDGAIYMTDTGVALRTQGRGLPSRARSGARITRSGATRRSQLSQAGRPQRDHLGLEGKPVRDRVLSGKRNLRLEAGRQGRKVARHRPRPAGWGACVCPTAGCW